MSRISRNILLSTPIIALAALGAQGAAAQSSGFYMDGTVRANYISGSTGEFWGMGDINLGYDAASAGGGNWGVEAAVRAFAMDSGVRAAYHVGLYYDTAYGRFTVGMPGGPLGDYVNTPTYGGSGMMQLEGGVLFGGVMDYLSIVSGRPVVGVRYDSLPGDFSYGMSVTTLLGDGAPFYAAAAAYENGNYTLSGGVESVDGDFGYSLSLKGEFDKFSALLAVGSPLALGSGDVFYDAELAYDAMENLTLTAGVIGGGSDPLMPYAGAEYTFMENGMAGLSVMGGSNTVYEAYVGWSFSFGG